MNSLRSWFGHRWSVVPRRPSSPFTIIQSSRRQQPQRYLNLRCYMDVRTRPSHSRMFDPKTGRVTKESQIAVPPAQNNNTRRSIVLVAQTYSDVVAKVFGGGMLLSSLLWNHYHKNKIQRFDEQQEQQP